MEDYDSRRLQRLTKRLAELRTWRNAHESPVEPWLLKAGGKSYELGVGDRWPVVETPVSFEGRARVPEEWAGEPVELELWLGGEAFVRLSNGAESGLNPFHLSFPVAEAAQGGEEIGIHAEAVPKGLAGSSVAEPRIGRASLVVPERRLRALELDLALVLEACESLGGLETVPRLLDAAEAALAALYEAWPSGTGESVARLLVDYRDPAAGAPASLPPGISGFVPDAAAVDLPWSLPSPARPAAPLPERARCAVERAREALVARLAELRREHPPVGRLALTGHAHLDLAWLWPVEETRRKGRRTFANVLSLMERYPGFTFSQSSAQLYDWIEQDVPEMFEKVRTRVAEGRWEPVGGSWTEPDCQMPSGESFVRQLLYGQRYFASRFGRRSTVAWLPDVFGFSPALPQILRGTGISGFFTYKLKWNETNKFPYDLFIWEGLDGSRVTAHSFENPGMDYNGDVSPRDLTGTWRNFRGKRDHPESLFSFGWGDGGGGPTERMLESYDRLKEFPALPRLRMARVDEFFDSLPCEGLPRWVGELYLELHRGTLTTQGRTKRLNRAAEHRLLEAEAFSTLAALRGAKYPREELEAAWKAVLLNQFHDILPGSSISEVYERAERELSGVVESAERLRDAAPGGMDGPEPVVGNASLYPRPLSVILPDSAPVPEGLASQHTEDGLLVHEPSRRVAGLGWTALSAAEAVAERVTEARATRSGNGAVLENGVLRVEILGDGTLASVYDPEAGREALSGRGNRLVAYSDRPREWEAWDVDEDYELGGEELGGVEAIEVVEEGPLRAAVRVERRFRGSRIAQTYRLLSGSQRLDVATHIDWHERRVLLRALFPVAVRSHEATFETMFGAVRRPTHRNTSWDAVRFEVSGHRFCDLSEPGYGVALMNDGRYGHSARDGVLGLSLLRSPMYPDPFADEGEHRFTYSLCPHSGNWTQARVAREAFALNSPLFAAHAPEGGAGEAFVVAEGLELALGSLKLAEEEGIILRLYEPHGARGRSALRFAGYLAEVERVNLLEELEGEAPEHDGETVSLEVRPFEVVTLRLRLG